MGEIISLLLFLLAANLDTVMLAMSWGLRQRRFSRKAVFVIAAVTTAATWLALALGGWAGSLLAGMLAKRLGGALLLAMGVWMLVDGLREKEDQAPVPASLAECGALALALGANNMGMGVGAGLAGLGPEVAALCNFLDHHCRDGPGELAGPPGRRHLVQPLCAPGLRRAAHRAGRCGALALTGVHRENSGLRFKRSPLFCWNG